MHARYLTHVTVNYKTERSYFIIFFLNLTNLTKFLFGIYSPYCVNFLFSSFI